MKHSHIIKELRTEPQMKVPGQSRLAVMAVFFLASVATSAFADDAPLLPWQREAPLREAAQSVSFESTLDPTNPQPDYGGNPFGGPSMTIDNLKMRSTIWGPPDRITISVTKNNVWDRRLHEFTVPSLQEITDGAFAPANKDYAGVKGNSLRPLDLGWLQKAGGPVDPYRRPIRYAFPCLKPVGQIIIGIDALTGAKAPTLWQQCGSGLVTLQANKGDASAKLEYVLSMTADTYAIRGSLTGINSPVTLRLYRHQDTTHLMYMTPDGKHYTDPAAEADKAFNGPIEPPSSGTDGPYFWIRQKMPPEKTFPQGFEYVLMGVMKTPGDVQLTSVEGQRHLGTPPANQRLNGEWHNAMRPAIADAPGAAATASFSPADGKLEAFVTVVTTMDGPNMVAVAKRRLADAQAAGFEGILRDNANWWKAFYDTRENGRIFYGSAGREVTDDIRAIYRSWTCGHGGGTKTDMRRYECSASYALPERDFQEWDSAPCYNEIFHTQRFVRNWGDSVDMYKQLLWHWMPAGELNAREMCNAQGMLISHGYLPPVKPDKYVHTTITLEFCLGTMAQVVRPVWDEWDYGGDVNFLRSECYPLMRNMALFYASYAKKGDDGFYHVIPSMEEERWGFYPQFARNKDVISSLCMFRWGLTRAADAAEFLGVDPELRKHWREVAAQLTPYPTWTKPQGIIFAGMPGVEPMHLANDHFGDAAAYPTVLADEINLDSPADQKDLMLRSVRTLTSGNTAQTLMLLGAPEDPNPRAKRSSGRDAETLLNSRSGRIHLFPDAPAPADIAFYHFQAEGGFLVSAARNAQGVSYLEIEPRRDNACLLMNPWPGKRVVVHEVGKVDEVPVALDNKNGECVIFPSRAGRRYLVETKN
jgi:hypothetical protein